MNKMNRFFLGLIVLILAGCGWLIPGENEDYEINYFSKEVIFNRYIDPDETDLQPVETWLYGEDGKLAVVFVYTYAEQLSSGMYANTRTDVYEVEDDGSRTLVEYYKYSYQQDDYVYEDDDGNLVSDYDFILNRGETYSPSDELKLYYTVTYEISGTDFDSYLTIIDYADDGSEVARQESTYITDGYGYQRYKTEKYYAKYDGSLILEKEYAAWYDDEEPYDYLYELYHSIRSSEGETSETASGETEEIDEFYYLTYFERDSIGEVYEQADRYYDPAAIPTEADGSFDTSVDFTYQPAFSRVGGLATVLITEYDSLGYVVLDERYLNGDLIEYTTFSYNGNSELLDQHHYTRGGAYLYDRVSVRYTDEEWDGEYVRRVEKCTYKYYEEQVWNPGSRSTLVNGAPVLSSRGVYSVASPNERRNHPVQQYVNHYHR